MTDFLLTSSPNSFNVSAMKAWPSKTLVTLHSSQCCHQQQAPISHLKKWLLPSPFPPTLFVQDALILWFEITLVTDWRCCSFQAYQPSWSRSVILLTIEEMKRRSYCCFKAEFFELSQLLVVSRLPLCLHISSGISDSFTNTFLPNLKKTRKKHVRNRRRNHSHAKRTL